MHYSSSVFSTAGVLESSAGDPKPLIHVIKSLMIRIVGSRVCIRKTLSDNQQVPRTRHEPAVIKYILMSLSHKAIPLSYISSAHIAIYLKQEVSCVFWLAQEGVL